MEKSPFGSQPENPQSPEHLPINPEQLEEGDLVWDKSTSEPIEGAWAVWKVEEETGEKKKLHLVRPDTREAVVIMNLRDMSRILEDTINETRNPSLGLEAERQAIAEAVEKKGQEIIEDFVGGFVRDNKPGGILGHREESLGLEQYEQFDPRFPGEEAKAKMQAELTNRLNFMRKEIVPNMPTGHHLDKVLIKKQLDKLLNEIVAVAAEFHRVEIPDEGVHQASGQLIRTQRTEDFVESGYQNAPTTEEKLREEGIELTPEEQQSLSEREEREAKLKTRTQKGLFAHLRDAAVSAWQKIKTIEGNPPGPSSVTIGSDEGLSNATNVAQGQLAEERERMRQREEELALNPPTPWTETAKQVAKNAAEVGAKAGQKMWEATKKGGQASATVGKTVGTGIVYGATIGAMGTAEGFKAAKEYLKTTEKVQAFLRNRANEKYDSGEDRAAQSRGKEAQRNNIAQEKSYRKLADKVREVPELYRIAYQAAQEKYPLNPDMPQHIADKYGGDRGIWKRAADEIIYHALLDPSKDVEQPKIEKRREANWDARWTVDGTDPSAAGNRLEYLKANREAIVEQRFNNYKTRLHPDDQLNLELLKQVRARFEKDVQRKIDNWSAMDEDRSQKDAFISDLGVFLKNADLNREWGINTPLYKEVERRLLREAKEVVEGAANKEATYKEQEELIVKEEGKDADIFKKLVEEAITLRELVSRTKVVGKIRLYLFDHFTGDRYKRLAQEGGKKSQATTELYAKEALSSINEQLAKVKAIVGAYKTTPASPSMGGEQIKAVVSLFGSKAGTDELLKAWGVTDVKKEFTETTSTHALRDLMESIDASKVIELDKNFVDKILGDGAHQLEAKDDLKALVRPRVDYQADTAIFEIVGASLSNEARAILTNEITDELFSIVQRKARENIDGSAENRRAA